MLINKWLKSKFKKNNLPEQISTTDTVRPRTAWDNLDIYEQRSNEDAINYVNERTFLRKAPVPITPQGTAMDGFQSNNQNFSLVNSPINPIILQYFADQGFIGYQLCAILAQHYLIDKACAMPGEDAIRNWFEITINNGKEELDPAVKDKIKELDVEYKLSKNLLEFIRMGRVFGIRLLLFEVDSDDPNYYVNPFNIDGVKPNSYRGMTQIDPYWVTPELDMEAASNPRSPYFYEPTWWRINSKIIHRSHFIILRTTEVSDILKPSYFYGGVSIPQKIFYRVFAAERTADEAPQLAVTKRTMVINTDLPAALANPQAFMQRMSTLSNYRSNFGAQLLDFEDKVTQLDTSLADLDNVIMTQYQLVAAAAGVPGDKLLGTSPKGFNTTGEYERESYHEHLKSLQTHNLTPAVQRHYELLIRSEIVPQFDIEPFHIGVVWKPLNEMTAKEKADLNKTKADTGQVLISSGAIDGSDERARIISDSDSGYDGLDIDPEDNNTDIESPDEEELSY